MKLYKKIILTFLLMAPLTITAIDRITHKQIATQIVILKHMLKECNRQYINNITPTYQQNLTLQWWLLYFIPFIASSSNTERLLTEANNLSSIIIVMEKLENIDFENDQIQELINMLLQCNNVYLQHNPIYKQDLTTQSYLNYCFPIKLLQANNFYNAEILLAESKKLADLTYNMSQFQNNSDQNNSSNSEDSQS